MAVVSANASTMQRMHIHLYRLSKPLQILYLQCMISFLSANVSSLLIFQCK